MSRTRQLTHREENRIRHAINDRVMHFSPTISPAPKREDRKEIESIWGAVDYYREHNETCLIMQPKYMGSYCDIYLHRNIEQTRFFSRKGYTIPSFVKHEDLIKAVRPLWESFFVGADGVFLDMVIVQAELMPWSALGKGLIEREFRGYEECHQTHCDYLRETELGKEASKMFDSPEFQKFVTDRSQLSRSELKKAYPDHIVKQYEALLALRLPNVAEYQNAIDVYREQVDIYGADGELHFKPFNWLKKIYLGDYRGGEEVNEDNILGFIEVTDDPYALINLEGTDKDIQVDVENAYAVFDEWTKNQKMEGVVIKPRTVWRDDMAPMFKVRNPRYLQMIYGVQFLPEFDYYLGRRGIRKKMRCSINEWNIAQALLRIPMSEISPDNEEYVRLVTARILEEDFEATLDSRL